MSRWERVVILGNGVAGNTALEAVRRSDPSARVVIVSEEPYPEYSACVLPHYVSGSLERKRVFLKSLKDYEGIKARLGERVREIDPSRGRVLLERGNIPYDRLILALGGEPVMPSIEGIDGRGVYPLKTLRDADRLARLREKSVVVIGSGLIGVEAAVAMRKRGHRVSLISRRWVLPRIVDEDVAERAQKILERDGVEVFTHDIAKEILLKGREVRALQTEKTKIPCDLIVVAIGVKPRAELAREAGIEMGPLNGIKVNEKMETDQPGIFACGDCAETVDPKTGETVLALRWLNARQMGRAAGLNSMGVKATYGMAPAGVVLDLFGTAVGSVGKLRFDLRETKVDTIETDHGASYARVLVSDGEVKGAQFIGRTEEAGILFSLVQKSYPYKDLSKGFLRFPWSYKLDQYLTLYEKNCCHAEPGFSISPFRSHLVRS